MEIFVFKEECLYEKVVCEDRSLENFVSFNSINSDNITPERFLDLLPERNKHYHGTLNDREYVITIVDGVLTAKWKGE